MGDQLDAAIDIKFFHCRNDRAKFALLQTQKIALVKPVQAFRSRVRFGDRIFVCVKGRHHMMGEGSIWQLPDFVACIAVRFVAFLGATCLILNGDHIQRFFHPHPTEAEIGIVRVIW